MRTLVIGDHSREREDLRRALVLEGWDLVLTDVAAEAIKRAQVDKPDAIVLDSELRDAGGLELCRLLRRTGCRTPILMLTTGRELADRIACLGAGADDFMIKPCHMAELQARLRSLVRRAGNGSWGPLLRFEELELDAEQHVARIGGREVRLTRTEHQLLELFMLNPRRVLPPDLIYDRVWGYDFGPEGNALRVYIGYLRGKLEAEGERRLLHTLRGVGYVLREPDSNGNGPGAAP